MLIEFYNSMTLFSLRGRTTKKEYQKFIVHWIIVSFILASICFGFYISTFNININFATFEISGSGELSVFPFAFLVLFSSVFMLFQFWSAVVFGFLTVKRLHDLNISGWYFWTFAGLFLFICISDCTILNGFLLYILLGGILFLSFADGYPFSNKYDIITSSDGNLLKKLLHGKI